jgi:hypothetical protein
MADNTPQNGTQTTSAAQESLTVEGGRDEILAIFDDIVADGQDDSRAAPKTKTDDEIEADEADDEGDEPEASAESAEDADEGSEENADEGEGEPQSFTVKVDGKDEKVTLDELLKGYSRTADYTRKTQKAAEDRKVFETEQASTREAREKHLAAVKEFETTLEALGPKEPDWDKLRVEDPDNFPKIHAEWQLYQGRRQKIADERKTLEQKQAADNQAAFQRRIEQERELVKEVIPEFKDRVKGKKMYDEMRGYAVSVGFTADEFNSMYDHRALKVLADATRLRRGESREAKVPSNPTSKDPVLRAGGKKPMTSDTKAMLDAGKRLEKTGSIDDAVDLFRHVIRSK